MRILIAHSFYRLSGGEDRYVTQQVELLRDAGHEVELLAKRNEDLPGGLATARRMTYSRTQTAEVTDVIERFSPDVIHVHNIYPALGPSVHLAAKKAKIPLVMTVHNFRLRCPNGYMFTEGEICRRCAGGNHLNAITHACFPTKTQAVAYAFATWNHRFTVKLEDSVATFIAPSEFMRQQLISWGMADTPVELLRNFTDVPHAPSTAIGTYGMFLGRLSSEKGVDLLLEALALAGDPPFQIVGGGPLAMGLQELARSLGLRRTTFLGQQDLMEVQRLLRESRFVVLPSLSNENAPLAALEAMSDARPLIVTDRGGLPELIREGAGVVVEPQAPVLAGALRDMNDSDELCQRMGAAAHSFAERNLSRDVHLHRLEDILHTGS